MQYISIIQINFRNINTGKVFFLKRKMKIIQNSLLLLLLSFALAFPMENSQSDEINSSIQSVPGPAETSQADKSVSSNQAASVTDFKLIPYEDEQPQDTIQVSFETVEKFKFIKSKLENDDFEESRIIPGISFRNIKSRTPEISFRNINSRTLKLLVKYANSKSFLDNLRYLLFNLVMTLLVMSSCFMKY